MSLMSGLYVGTSGLQTSQNALNTTAHNLTNVETTGYVRQQVLQEDKNYNHIGNSSVSQKQVGLGVEYGKVRQVRDSFLDKSYRLESGRSAFYDIMTETTNEIETLLGEFDGVAFQDSIGKLWTSVQELQKDPSSAVVQGEFVNNAAQFIERAQAVYNGLKDYQDNLNERVKDKVDRINELGREIYELNLQINHEESNRLSEANDLRDRMNSALDELGALANISYFTNADGATEVLVEGIPLVGRDRVFEMSTETEEGTGFIYPIWPQNENQRVYILQKADDICTKNNSDVGELKGLIYARGDRRANYTDIEEVAYGEVYDGKMATETSTVMKVQAELDNMVHHLMVSVNDILVGDVKDPTASYTKAEVDAMPQELFVRLGTERYVEQSDGTYKYIAEDTSGTPADISKMYTIANVKINSDILKEPASLGNGFVLEDKNVDYARADAMAEAFEYPFGSLNPRLTLKLNYKDYYSALVGQTGTEGSVYMNISNAQQIAVSQVDDARQAIIGVSSNEELSNMIKYQNAYNAASRYITALNEMLENMISTFQ